MNNDRRTRAHIHAPVIAARSGGGEAEPPAAAWMRLIGHLGLWLLWASAAACASVPQLVPETATQAAFAGNALIPPSSSGVTLVGVPGEWRYSPKNLPEHVTPVRVKVTNLRPDPILLSLEDARLLDERGTRYAAVSPGDAVQRAARAYGPGGSGGPGIQPGVSISQGIGIGGVGIQIGGIGIGGGPYGGSNPDRGEKIDALEVGLRPGRLDPGASVEGYLFFETPLKASDRSRRFRAAWDIRPVTALGAPLAPPFATLEVPLIAR